MFKILCIAREFSISDLYKGCDRARGMCLGATNFFLHQYLEVLKDVGIYER
jgi:hypothetical protein